MVRTQVARIIKDTMKKYGFKSETDIRTRMPVPEGCKYVDFKIELNIDFDDCELDDGIGAYFVTVRASVLEQAKLNVEQMLEAADEISRAADFMLDIQGKQLSFTEQISKIDIGLFKEVEKKRNVEFRPSGVLI